MYDHWLHLPLIRDCKLYRLIGRSVVFSNSDLLYCGLGLSAVNCMLEQKWYCFTAYHTSPKTCSTLPLNIPRSQISSYFSVVFPGIHDHINKQRRLAPPGSKQEVKCELLQVAQHNTTVTARQQKTSDITNYATSVPGYIGL